MRRAYQRALPAVATADTDSAATSGVRAISLPPANTLTSPTRCPLATGSASATLGALLLSLDGGDKAAFTITQGVEMGRPSLLKVTSWRAEDGCHARVGGSCIPMFRGEALL